MATSTNYSETCSNVAYDSFAPKRPQDEFIDISHYRELEFLELAPGLHKGTLEPAITAPATSCDFVYFLHETRFDNGQLANINEVRKAPEKLELGKVGNYPYYETALRSMGLNECAVFRLESSVHEDKYFAMCTPEELQALPSKDVWLLLRMKDIRRNVALTGKDSLDQRMQFGLTCKEIGKLALDEGKPGDASKIYTKGVGLLQSMPKAMKETATEEQEHSKAELIKSLLLNVAFSYLQTTDQWQKAEKSLDQVLQLDPKSVKALYRKALVLKKKGEYDDAKEHVIRAIEVEPNNKVLRGLHSELNAKKRERAEKWKKEMGGFFYKERFRKMEVEEEEDRFLKAKIEQKRTRKLIEQLERGTDDVEEFLGDHMATF